MSMELQQVLEAVGDFCDLEDDAVIAVCVKAVEQSPTGFVSEEDMETIYRFVHECFFQANLLALSLSGKVRISVQNGQVAWCSTKQAAEELKPKAVE